MLSPLLSVGCIRLIAMRTSGSLAGSAMSLNERIAVITPTSAARTDDLQDAMMWEIKAEIINGLTHRAG